MAEDIGILKFYETAKAKEFARDFQFRVVTLGPLGIDDLVYLKTANLPGKEIANQPTPYMGLDFNVPGAVKFTGSDAWTVTFRADEAMNIRSKLEAWMNEIFNVESSSGKYGTPAENLEPLGYDISGNGKVQEFNATLAYQYYSEV